MGGINSSSIFLPSSDTVFALLEDTKKHPDEAISYLFLDPVEQIIASDKTQIKSALARVDDARAAGHFICGYITYEAGYHMVDKRHFTFKKSDINNLPYIHFYVFSKCIRLTRTETDSLLNNAEPIQATAVYEFALSETKERYLGNLATIHKYILEGDTYQVNHTLKYHFKYEGSPLALYRELRQKQSVEYGAFLNFPECRILSFSPELFIKKTGRVLESKPMKGTARRGTTSLEDEKIKEHLKNDPKTQSENVMIVDLIRNDIGRIACGGTVQVNDLFEVQSFKTLHQMISTITGEVPREISIAEVFANLFPCGSITGAPKIRTMEIIEELEAEHRGIYTGAIGYIMPNNDFCFNVPIRTIVSTEAGRAEMGIGSGIIFEADAPDEYEECRLKARFLTGINDHFQLIEAIQFDGAKKIFLHLSMHLARLQRSAEIFGFRYDPEQVIAELNKAVDKILYGTHKIRILLWQNGDVNITVSPIVYEQSVPRRLLLSNQRINSSCIFQYHKTTVRSKYETTYQEANANGAYDVLFLNEHGQLAEASRHNLFLENEGRLYTPPISAGVLPGVYREMILRNSTQSAIEKELYYEDLLCADRIYLTNAIRGIVQVELAHLPGQSHKRKDKKYALPN